MLITIDYSLSQSSQYLGFSDVKYISKYSKKLNWQAPRQYKKEKRLKKATKQVKYSTHFII